MCQADAKQGVTVSWGVNGGWVHGSSSLLMILVGALPRVAGAWRAFWPQHVNSSIACCHVFLVVLDLRFCIAAQVALWNELGDIRPIKENEPTTVQEKVWAQQVGSEQRCC